MRSRLPVGLIALVALAGQASAQLTPDWSARHGQVMSLDSAHNIAIVAGTTREGSTGLMDILTLEVRDNTPGATSNFTDGPSITFN